MDDAIAGLVGRGLVHSTHARAAGLDPRTLRRAAAASRVVRVRRDAYLDTERWQDLSPRSRYRLQVEAASRSLSGPVFTHFSAAVVWDLPLIGRWPAEVHVAGSAARGGRSWPGVVRHASDLDVPVVNHDGIRVTDAAATVIDMARVSPFATALAMADHALRTKIASAEGLVEAAAALGARRGSRAARRVAELADHLSESAGESLSRARMIELAAPLPRLQHTVRDARGFVARADFWWEHLGLVGEFDGRLKYRVDGLEDQAAVEERVWTEKLREDRIRATGLGVTRWTWQTALDARAFAAHLRAAGVL
ncbi:hypothetical protein [Cellulomonas rhizosphaerae]|uniref:hypothetical protein n=1 Tax=Cellulomonas rhizosphaerae TaxID=2293719 RepID=UPI0011C2313B|nr:hypothetical protein [Cellulomonas rhizosphaerae]